MKLTVIGCWGGYPAPGEASSSYLLEKDDFTLVIDMGSASLSKIQTYKSVLDLNAVILSHYHTDHIADVGVLQHALLVQSYLKERTDVLPIYGHHEDEAAFTKLSHDFTKGHAYVPNEELHIGPFSIRFLKTNHSVVCYGMRITDGEQTIIYTADTAYKDVWIPFAKDADLLIVDCNFYEGQNAGDAGHMTSEEGAYIASEASVSNLLLTHLPQFGDHSQLVREAKQSFKGTVDLAYEGFVWEKD